MKTAIVTGANGFVGNAVANELSRNGMKIIAVVNNNTDRVKDSDFEVIKCKMADYKELENSVDSANIFYHFAWNGSAGPLRADYNVQLDNVKQSLDALQVAKNIGCKRFVSAGSIMENETIDAVFTNGNKPGVGYIYGAGKTAFHLIGIPLALNIGIEMIVGMITNAYGIGEKSPRLVNTTIRKCLNKETPEFTSGTQNYDFVYIDDVARAFRCIGENGKPYHKYIIGSSNAKPLREFLLEMQKSIAPEIEFKFGNVPFSGVDLPLSTFDCSDLEKDTGFKATVSFSEGCRRTMDWMKNGG